MATLQTLQRFLTWIPFGYIFETPLISLLVEKFFPVNVFRVATVECLTEIAGLSEAQYDPVFLNLYTQFLTQVSQVVQPDSVAALYDLPDGEEFLKLLALFLSSFFKVGLGISPQTPPHFCRLLGSHALD